ncbi:glycoside hydrolase family 13 protein [Rhodoferax sp.]|uniref:glycoside hydrolase family 13 protein n=1 Tax=Rhodoferax sp. TaxID=50421 RepID=UPI0027599D64|nr:glycoside hydrolase family 13 protein [Rhodoferax sp.]
MSLDTPARRWAARHRNLLAACAVFLCVQAPAQAASAPAQGPCRAEPLGGRALYLRGSFNSWNASDTQKFTWACKRYELVTRLVGEHRFKVADEGWSADADFGRDRSRPAAPLGQGGAPERLTPQGAEFEHRFEGVHRLHLTMDDSNANPVLQIERCPADAPFGPTTLFLRGSMNNWAALDEFAFQYRCDAYYLNVKLLGRHEFKIADPSWNEATSFGQARDATLLAGATTNLAQTFDGEHTIRLAIVDGKPQLSVGNKTFADPLASAVTDPVALSLRFDSRGVADKSPFGAVVAGSTISFGLGALPGASRVTLVVERRHMTGNQEVLEYTEVARLPMTRSTVGKLDRWTASHRFTDVSVYGYWFEVEIGGKRFAYQNNRDPVFWTREKGSGGLGAVADLPASIKSVRRFRQTVHAADFKVPDWAPDVVYYYVFPDRFRNGKRSNDPKPGQDRYHDQTVELHSNWLDKPWKPGTGDGSDAVFNNDFFGGDLAGIIDKLDYIRDLGANTIYMTPIFKAASNHKYDTADYKTVDPAFGSNADFERLTAEAARRGIRVIPDTSLNHTGSDSIYFDRFGNHQSKGAFEGGKIRRDSPYAGWYSFDPKQTEPDKQYKGWVGVTDLPELNKASPEFRHFAYGADDSVMKLWLDRGAAGWRMDVAPWVPDDFWREWRRAIKRHKPDALTIAETWFDASKYFLGDTFDSTMNYIFRNTVLDYANGGKASALYPNIELMREAYPVQAFYALMNLLSSHDQARALHQFGYLDETTEAATVARAKQRLRLAVFFQMVFPGAPTVYYGDEVGVTGGDDPYNRATYPWADLGGQPDTALLADFKRLIKLRKDHAVLRRGSLDAPLLLDEHLIVLLRQHDARWAITATNNAEVAKIATVLVPPELSNADFTDALTGQTVRAVGGTLTFTVPALYGTVLTH